MNVLPTSNREAPDICLIFPPPPNADTDYHARTARIDQ